MTELTEKNLAAMRAIRPETFSLKTPLLSGGMSRELLCRGENSTFRIHCYSTGMGEKHGFHAHTEEEHVFVVLQGEAVFSGLDGKLPVVGKNNGIWLPKGCFYEFYNPGPDPLIVLRFGALATGANESTRVTPEGAPIKGRSSANPELAIPVLMDGEFFA